MKKIYSHHMREGLSELASESLQRQLWLESEGPLVGSFTEAVEQVYDDSGLTHVLDGPDADAVLGTELVQLLRQLGDAVDAVEHNSPVADLIASPAMTRVRALADAARRALDDRTAP